MNAERDSTFREYAWNYFQLHAEQRLQMFEFYITISSAALGGYVLLVQSGRPSNLAFVVALALPLLSFVFWKLDVRTRGLVKNAEQALNHLDEEWNLPDMDGSPHPLRLFTRDDYLTNRLKPWPLTTGHFSYSRSFKWVYVCFAALGLFLAALDFVRAQP